MFCEISSNLLYVTLHEVFRDCISTFVPIFILFHIYLLVSIEFLHQCVCLCVCAHFNILYKIVCVSLILVLIVDCAHNFQPIVMRMSVLFCVKWKRKIVYWFKCNRILNISVASYHRIIES